jgi:hypothetical protein
MNKILPDAEALTVVIERVRPETNHVPRHSFEAAMEARALIADRQAAKEQQR